MVNNENNWRLLQYETSDPKMSLAVSEAIFRCNRAGLSPNTIYFWKTSNPIILFYSGSKHEISSEPGKVGEIELLRTCGVAGNNQFCDAGNINFSIAMNSKFLIPFLEGEYQPLLSEYKFLLNFFAEGIRGVGLKVKEEPYGIFTIEGREIASIQPAWIKDILLLQGTIYINTNLEKLNKVLKREVTSVSKEIGKTIKPQEILVRIGNEFEKKLNMSFKKEGPIETEQRLAEKLYNKKYNTEKWHKEGKAPFLALMGETLVALYVANPPTSKCRQLIEMVKRVTNKIMDEVKVIVWRRGAGVEQHPSELMPPVIVTLSKAHIIPAVIINGEVKFALEIPQEDDLREAIYNPDKYPDILGSLLKIRSKIS